MKNSASTRESINNIFRNPPIKQRRKKPAANKTGFSIDPRIILFAVTIAFLVIVPKFFKLSSQNLSSPKEPTVPCIWEICAIDTMKTSRDKARDYLNTPDYDEDIKQQLKIIKDSGANYVAIDTPYDAEFMPYLRRWVKYSREAGLKVWFRGNWSNWEGWFDYPKNMSPEDHLKKTEEFIVNNPDLFESDDIFDPCPECENSGFWPQNDKNKDYNSFIKTQQENTEKAFRKIKKWVKVRQSVIGGRAKDVLDKDTFGNLGNKIAIDHYVKSPAVMEEFINYFWENSKTKSLVSEFGAPIPDMNGPMDDKQQAAFVKQILEVLYKNRNKVEGLNYWVLSQGTTELVSENSTLKPAFFVLQEYFKPGEIYGTIKNPLNENIEGIQVKTSDGTSVTKTGKNGNFRLSIPPRNIEIVAGDSDYTNETFSTVIDKSGQRIEKNFTLEPLNPGIFYRFKLWWKNTTN